jgi:hypothetical protein
VPHRLLGLVLGGPGRAATGGVDVRVERVSKVVGGEGGHVPSLRHVGFCLAVRRHTVGVSVVCGVWLLVVAADVADTPAGIVLGRGVCAGQARCRGYHSR